MPTCQKCNVRFPFRWVDQETGQTHNLGTRKFCLVCSPFGKHNTKNILRPKLEMPDTHYFCIKCKETKLRKEFYLKGGQDGKPHSYCRKCGLENVLMQQRKVKAKAILYKGGSCNICGYSKYTGALEFHHLNPDEKDFSIGQSNVRIWSKLQPELDKCIMLCANCHREMHASLISLKDMKPEFCINGVIEEV